MRNAVIGLVIGIVAGIVLGTSVIAPRIKHLDEAAPVPAENAEAPAPAEGTADNAATVPPPTVTEVESVRLKTSCVCGWPAPSRRTCRSTAPPPNV